MSSRATLFANYLRINAETVHAEIVDVDGDSELDVVFDLKVDLPQRPVYDVREVERVRARFSNEDAIPKIFVLRDDFPRVPHLISHEVEVPRQLCLYEQPWQDESANWTPSNFLFRIRSWLEGTADGSLHRADQPLEPLLPVSPFKLVLPPLSLNSDERCWVQRFDVSKRSGSKGRVTFVCSEENSSQGSDFVLLPVLFVKMPVCQHGVISRSPETLGELDQVCSELGESLVGSIISEMSKWVASLSDPALKDSNIIIVLCLPKTRSRGGEVEGIEYKAFVVGRPIPEFIESSTVYTSSDGILVPRKAPQLENPEFLRSSGVIPMSVHFTCTRENLARMNGSDPNRLRILAIGVGTLGGYVSNNLVRKGFGRWTVLDSDSFDPHNVARHVLTGDCVGFSKAKLMAYSIQGVTCLEPLPEYLEIDYLNPGDDEGKLSDSLESADIVLDLSASISVSRALYRDSRSLSQRITLFLNQGGNDLVLLAEDRDRTANGFWLEAEYLKAVAFNPELDGHNDAPDSVAHRYGGSCREISSVISNDHMVTLSGIASKWISNHAQCESAFIDVFRMGKDGSVERVGIPVTAPIEIDTAAWKIRIHQDVVLSVAAYRKEQLPSETGGVLIGVVDRNFKQVSIVESLSAPADSEEWPSSFIRGCRGLRQKVDELEARTLGNLGYVGEWHSHPGGVGAEPSSLDCAAVDLNAATLVGEAMPTIMMIVAEDRISLLFKDSVDSELMCFMLGK